MEPHTQSHTHTHTHVRHTHILTNLEELSFLTVFAFPKAENEGGAED